MRYATLIILAALLASCGESSPTETTNSKPVFAKSTLPDQHQLFNNVNYENATLSDSTPIVAYPLVLKSTENTDALL